MVQFPREKKKKLQVYVLVGQINSTTQKDAIHGKVNVFYAFFTYIKAQSTEILTESCFGLVLLRVCTF